MKKLLYVIGFMMLSEISLAGVTQRDFKAPLGDEKWRVTGSRLRCGLSLKVLDYGIAYFEQYATKDPHFIMSNWQLEKRSSYATVWTFPPKWRRKLKPALVAKTTAKASEYIIYLRRIAALKLLSGLAEGYMARVNYSSDVGYKVQVDISPVHFKKSYSRYIRCVGNLLPFNFYDIELTKLYFNSGQDELTRLDRQVLDRVRLYVLVDPKVKSVRVSGYSDNTGRRGINNAVSEARAKAVANYLLSRGVPARKLYVTWYGMLHPEDSNDTEIGRAKNRRVIIKVVK